MLTQIAGRKVQARYFGLALGLAGLTLLLGSLLLGAGGSSAQAATPRFGEPVNLSDEHGEAHRPSVAISMEAGKPDAVALWDGVKITPEQYTFQSSLFEPGAGIWLDPLPVATDDRYANGNSTTDYPYVSSVVAHSEGPGRQTAVLVEHNQERNRFEIAAYSQAGLGWVREALLSSDSCVNVLSPKVVTNQSGLTAAAWVCSKSSGGYTVEYAIKATSSWTPAQPLSGECRPVTTFGKTPTVPDLAINHAGNVIFTWNCSSDGALASNQVQARMLAGGSLGTVYELNQGTPDTRPKAAIADNCSASVVYRAGATSSVARVEIRDLRGQGCGADTQQWSEPTVLSSGVAAWWPKVTADAAGNTAVIWYQKDDEQAPMRIKLRLRRQGESGGFGQIISLTDGDGSPERDGNCTFADVAGDSEGTVLATWTCQDITSETKPYCINEPARSYCYRVQAATYRWDTDSLHVSAYLSPDNVNAGTTSRGGTPRAAVWSDRGAIVYAARPPKDPNQPDPNNTFNVIQAIDVDLSEDSAALPAGSESQEQTVAGRNPSIALTLKRMNSDELTTLKAIPVTLNVSEPSSPLFRASVNVTASTRQAGGCRKKVRTTTSKLAAIRQGRNSVRVPVKKRFKRKLRTLPRGCKVKIVGQLRAADRTTLAEDSYLSR